MNHKSLRFIILSLALLMTYPSFSAVNSVNHLSQKELMQRLNITFTADSLDNGWLDNNNLSEVERQMTLIGIQSACNGNATVNADKKITSLDSSLKEYTENVYKFRKENPATWRGTTQFTSTTVADAHVLVVDKTDPVTGNRVLIVFSDGDTTVPVHGVGGIDVDAWRPEFVKIK